MAVFEPPPTWADPITVDERTGKSRFNPVWLRWFLELVGVINAAGGGGGGSFAHNSLTGLQGGGASEYYHFTAAEHTALAAGFSGTGLLLRQTGPQLLGTWRMPKADGTAQTATCVFAGTGAPSNADGVNGDYYFRSDGGAGTHIYFKTGGAWAGIV